MKKLITTFTTLITLVMLILLIFTPKNNFSDNENRYLEDLDEITFESIKKRRTQDNISNYISDHFPFRTQFLELKTKTERLLGKDKINGVYYLDNDTLVEEYTNPVNKERIVRIVNRFKKSLDEVEIDFMLVPTSAEIYKEDLPKYNLNDSELDTIKYYKNNLKTNFIDVTESLREHKDEYIYYRTDHHWTTLGSFYAYKKYCNDKNIDPINPKYKVVSKDFYGTLYSKVIDNSIKKDYISIVDNDNKYEIITNNSKGKMYDESYLNKKDKYSYFLGGNNAYMKITNEKGNGKLLIIKDSYANCFVPLISNNYKELIIIDPRYYNYSIKDLINDEEIKNILFLYNVKTIDDDLGILSINR